MAHAEERAWNRTERKLKQAEKEKNSYNGKSDDVSGAHRRHIIDGQELMINANRSELNENWERPSNTEIDESKSTPGNAGYKTQPIKDYTNTVHGGKLFEGEEDANFDPEVKTSSWSSTPPARKNSSSSVKCDEWSHLTFKKTASEKNECGGDKESSSLDQHKIAGDWRKTASSRGANKPKSQLKPSDSWIREQPQLPEEPILKEPAWLDLVRKRRWRSTVKARFPQTERERIQFERRLDTSKRGLKFNPRGEPTSITGPTMDDELSLYLLQQRRRIESDVVDSGVPSASRSSMSSPAASSVSSFSDSYFLDDDYHDNDPKNRELAAEQGILNLSRPPMKGPAKELHKNLAMERSRQSTMQWRFSADPYEAPLWTHLPKPTDVEALNDMDVGLEAKFWSSKKKFQTGQFNPPAVLSKPRSRSFSSGDGDLEKRSHANSLTSEEIIPFASRSNFSDMKQKLASGELLTSTPITGKPVKLDDCNSPNLHTKFPHLEEIEPKENKNSSCIKNSSYISAEEMAIMEESKNPSPRICLRKKLKPHQDTLSVRK
ncbi:uncharacterized protein LOC124435455 [Xenia sp. Carnegie-2017]|uniref:uncharacterized protein LOC124435455 n=1 Tax=Xenia sp. Carnegie-2017 TaxID=2897299 RepID=UPI001F03DE5A|nr:uncharacterized protein LOC124435455 [Xenia sp. Carnegie-2017]XP_046841353.1 uncharacterized protein LOC124435455 [Xenia sp. Carnegie-2017]XP_046841354.1 uncharacterized protein LOC124435455 [Xenia sp. Carnegie-2017]XP_046841355.1 uncharacterized protein LOC124435455 [Xenia sp. Carnegie-2017]XP_046841357.1 uncharacterized protein LOC124435455 [Xenia sp. Carnegie-2017]XP_046841358.1 uncharacterized protein LOC124435455 [Xenia sp. Carnegie-2017]